MLASSWDNEKENGNYYLGSRDLCCSNCKFIGDVPGAGVRRIRYQRHLHRKTMTRAKGLGFRVSGLEVQVSGSRPTP